MIKLNYTLTREVTQSYLDFRKIILVEIGRTSIRVMKLQSER